MGKRKNTCTADSKPKELAHASSSKSKSLKNGKSVLKPCSERKENLKKQKIHKEKSEEYDEDEKIVLKSEIKELKKSMQELSEAVKKLQEYILLIAKADLPEKEKETQKRKEEERDTCCFDCDGEFEHNEETIFVKGFQNLRPRDEIRSELRSIFGSCGEITRLFVPFECKSRLPLGFAFINLRNVKDIEKALELNGSYMGGRELEVTMATYREEYSGFTDFLGCERCDLFLSERKNICRGP